MGKVKIGHAVCDENGQAQGGKAGDQTRKEVRLSDYYQNTKGWDLLRAKNEAVAAKIAFAMTAACENDNIGYSQSDRSSLQTEAKKVGYDIAKILTPCNCDCSSLVRCCCYASGLLPGSFSTASEKEALLKTTAFDIVPEPWAETDLRLGDILITKTKGHTAIVTDAPIRTGETAAPPASGVFVFRRNLKDGITGEDVKALKVLLQAAGHGKTLTPTNPNFRKETNKAVREYQAAKGLTVDGVAGKNTITALGGVDLWQGA